MTHPVPDLYLITPLLEDPAAFLPALDAACAGGPVVAVLIRLAPADERTLVNRVKVLAGHEIAAIVADPGPEVDLANLVARGGADGGHSDDAARVATLCERLGESRNVGAGGLRTRHDAMTAGERGVDYVLFGEPRRDGYVPPLDDVAERAEWWAEIFQTPCVVYAPSLDALPRLAATGAEFVALGDAVWSHPDGPGEAVRAAARVLAGTVPA